MKLLIIFTILTFINVILSTFKSIVTVKGSWYSSALISGIYYGYYNIVLIFTVADFPIWQKVLITAIANLIGVAIVKLIDEKREKVMLWKIEATVLNTQANLLHDELNTLDIPHSYIENLGKYTVFNIYCETKKESTLIKDITNKYNAKYFVSETKVL